MVQDKISKQNKFDQDIAEKDNLISELKAEIEIQDEIIKDKMSEADLILKNKQLKN